MQIACCLRFAWVKCVDLVSLAWVKCVDLVSLAWVKCVDLVSLDLVEPANHDIAPFERRASQNLDLRCVFLLCFYRIPAPLEPDTNGPNKNTYEHQIQKKALMLTTFDLQAYRDRLACA